MTAQLNDLLKAVARSFYLSLRALPRSIRPPMSLAYLFCRAADSVADTDVLPERERSDILLGFKQVFSAFPISKEIGDAFANRLKDLDPDHPHEKRLLRELPHLFHTLNGFSRPVQALIQQVVLGVIQGMEMDFHFFGKNADTLKALPRSEDLDRYIGLIGGEPGRFWSLLCLEGNPSLNRGNRGDWIENGIVFGKGLQMINILRDLPRDLQRGRCYVPEEFLTKHRLSPRDLLDTANTDTFLPLYHSLIDDTLSKLSRGVLYLMGLRRWDFKLRLAVWLPLAIGLKTLRKLRAEKNVLNKETVVKIKRGQVFGLLAQSLVVVPFNRMIQWEFEDLAGTASSSITEDRFKLKKEI